MINTLMEQIQAFGVGVAAKRKPPESNCIWSSVMIVKRAHKCNEKEKKVFKKGLEAAKR